MYSIYTTCKYAFTIFTSAPICNKIHRCTSSWPLTEYFEFFSINAVSKIISHLKAPISLLLHHRRATPKFRPTIRSSSTISRRTIVVPIDKRNCYDTVIFKRPRAFPARKKMSRGNNLDNNPNPLRSSLIVGDVTIRRTQ